MLGTYCMNTMVAGVLATVVTVAEPVTVIGVPEMLKVALAVLVMGVLGGVAARAIEQ